MTNYEEIKQGLADYEAKVAKANAKFPERKEFKEKPPCKVSIQP